MATASLLPAPFWFRWRFPCPWVDLSPAPKGRMWSLPAESRLPIPWAMEGKKPWWQLSAGWSEAGLGFSLDVEGKRTPAMFDADHPNLSDGLQLWIDTRDTRDVHRATRHCHQFLARVSTRKSTKEPHVEVEARKIHRALADAPTDKASRIVARSGLTRTGWWLDLFLPAETLHGYDPDTNPRLGFGYSLHDPVVGDQFLTVGRDFPIGEDPSLWSTLELAAAPSSPAAAIASPRKRARRSKGDSEN